MKYAGICFLIIAGLDLIHAFNAIQIDAPDNVVSRCFLGAIIKGLLGYGLYCFGKKKHKDEE